MNKASKLSIYILLILFSSTHLWAQDELNTYLEKAAKNNPGLKASFNQYLASLEMVPQAGSLPDPQLMFGIFISPVETRVGAQRGNISLTQAFPWFGTLGAQKNAATMMAKANFEKFENAKLKLLNEVKTTYFNLYFLHKSIDITRQNILLLETFKQLTQVSFESGKSGFVDVLRVEMELEDLKNKLLYLEDSQKPILAKFDELLNETPEQPIVLPDTLWSEEISAPRDSIFQTISSNSPQLKQFDFESDSYASQIEAARKMGLPSFNVGFNYINVAPRTDMTFAGNGKDAFVFPQVGVRLPLYRSKYKSMVKENEIKQEAVSFNKENTQNKLITEFEKVYRDYADAERRVGLYSKQFTYSSQSLALLITQYSTDGKNFEEVIRMERRKLGYALELEKARTEQNTYAAYINYLMGK